ncbi:cyclin-dependent kinases regulatory subunit, putative [Plasmodium vivax]|uniref:Cyclin-dependent kinases regulatory subunit n=1 Tax=Plasmodium vivax TaxID=5855 RepID=A0A1G4GVH8_PLAVI|nr:cyclin-dependent kinases regulatory subunit, putative [Plasmodium vivax]
MNRPGGTPLNRSSREKSNEKNGAKSASKGVRRSSGKGISKGSRKSGGVGSGVGSGVSNDVSSSISSRANATTDRTTNRSTDEGADNPAGSSPKSAANNPAGSSPKSAANNPTGSSPKSAANNPAGSSPKSAANNPAGSSPKSAANNSGHDDYYAILEELAKSETPKFRSVQDSMDENLNLEFLRSSSENYTYKITSRGPVCYSALYRDDKYVYRHIILSDNVRQYAESKVRKTNAFLTEHCIVNELQIDIGKGWKHFMIYDGKIRELILRKVLTAEDKLRMAVQAQKYN